MKKITKIFAGMAAFAVLAAGAALAGCSSNNTVGFEDKVTARAEPRAHTAFLPRRRVW